MVLLLLMPMVVIPAVVFAVPELPTSATDIGMRRTGFHGRYAIRVVIVTVLTVVIVINKRGSRADGCRGFSLFRCHQFPVRALVRRFVTVRRRRGYLFPTSTAPHANRHRTHVFIGASNADVILNIDIYIIPPPGYHALLLLLLLLLLF